MSTSRHFARAVCTAFFVALLPSVTAAQHDACRSTTEALEQIREIRSLAPKRKVPCAVYNKAQVERFLRETIATKLPPNKVEMEQLVYRALGIIPDDYDYKKGVIDLYVSQLGGFYDPEKRHLVLAGWLSDALQTPVIVHELTHALQDQHFDLGAMLDPKSDNGDQQMALAALIEGDATAVMYDYLRLLAAQQPLRAEKNIDALLVQQVLLSGLSSNEPQGPPAAIQASLLFPYSSGLRFVHHLLRKGGYSAVSAALKDPPRSSREILHPEHYLAPTTPLRIPTAAELPRENPDLAPVYTDVIGEFLISALLSSGQPDKDRAVKAATGWLGDRVGVFTIAPQRVAVSWKTVWESAADALEFEEMYLSLLKRRYPSAVVTGGSILTLPTKTVTITRTGAEVDVYQIISNTEAQSGAEPSRRSS